MVSEEGEEGEEGKEGEEDDQISHNTQNLKKKWCTSEIQMYSRSYLDEKKSFFQF